GQLPCIGQELRLTGTRLLQPSREQLWPDHRPNRNRSENDVHHRLRTWTEYDAGATKFYEMLDQRTSPAIAALACTYLYSRCSRMNGSQSRMPSALRISAVTGTSLMAFGCFNSFNPA